MATYSADNPTPAQKTVPTINGIPVTALNQQALNQQAQQALIAASIAQSTQTQNSQITPAPGSTLTALDTSAADAASRAADAQEALATALSGDTTSTTNTPDTPDTSGSSPLGAAGGQKVELDYIPTSPNDTPSGAYTVAPGSLPDTSSTSSTTPNTPPPPGTPLKIYTAPDGTQFTDQQAYATYMASYNAIQAQKAAAAAATLASQKSASQLATAILQGYGLTGDIADGVFALAQNGLDSTTINAILDSSNPLVAIQNMGLSASQLTAAQGLVASWQQRFSGNQIRIANGLTPLDPATYISTENSYKQVMSMAGISQNNPLISNDYIGKLIGADVSSAEASQRINAATSAIQNEDPEVIAQLQSQFGLSQETLVSHLLDPTVSAPLVQQEYNAATIAAEAARSGVAITVGNTAGNTQSGGLTNQNALQMQLAAQGVTQAQAATGFQTIAQEQPNLQSIASRYGAGITGATNIGNALVAAQFGTTGAAQAQAELNRLTTAEISAFSGSAGAVTGSLGPRDASGQI